MREVRERILDMLFGAMDELRIGDPWDLATDVGPVIEDEARERIEWYCRRADREGRTLKRLAVPGDGRFVPPTVLRVDGIEALEQEVFGPVLHVAACDADRINDRARQRIAARRGGGLTGAVLVATSPVKPQNRTMQESSDSAVLKLDFAQRWTSTRSWYGSAYNGTCTPH